MWASPFCFLILPQGLPCARACSQIISYAILKESKLCVFPVFFGFSKGSSYGIHYHLRLIRAGKSSAAAFLEDLGFYCVDNMPVALITNFAGLCMAGRAPAIRPGGPGHRHPRGPDLDELFQALDGLREMHLDYQLLFIEAADEDIVRRYKETRHTHPSPARATPCREAVKLERLALEPVRRRASHILNSTGLNLSKFRGAAPPVRHGGAGGEHDGLPSPPSASSTAFPSTPTWSSMCVSCPTPIILPS